jgi:hypothetical protein
MNSQQRRQLRRLLHRAGVEIADRDEQAPKETAVRKSEPIWKRVPRAIYAALGVFGLLITFVMTYPWLSLERGDRADPNDMLSTTIDITNEGLLPLWGLSATCEYGEVRLPRGIVLQGPTDTRQDFLQVLYYKHKTTSPCYKSFKAYGYQSPVDLKMTITYRLFPWRRFPSSSQSFRFRAIPTESGSYWVSVD